MPDGICKDECMPIFKFLVFALSGYALLLLVIYIFDRQNRRNLYIGLSVASAALVLGAVVLLHHG